MISEGFFIDVLTTCIPIWILESLALYGCLLWYLDSIGINFGELNIIPALFLMLGWTFCTCAWLMGGWVVDGYD